MSIVIVGSGVVGLATAYWLQRAGHDVELVERATVGSGASRGNAGEICPELATPVAKLSLIRSAATQAYRHDSALHVSPSALPSHAGFLARIVSNALPARYRENSRELSLLAEAALEAFAEMADEVGFPVIRDGYLHLYDSRSRAEAGRSDISARLVASVGSARDVGPVLSPSEVTQLEPYLKPAGYGFVYEGGTFVDPNVVVDRLRQHVQGRGARVHEGVTVTHVSRDREHSVAHSDRGEFRADSVVVAAGTGSGQIAAASGEPLPIRAGKGYSFTIDPSPAARRVVKFESAHVALLPMGDRARIAGTMEFDTDPHRFNPRRVGQIVSALAPYIDEGVLAARTNEWVGARPVTPDGLPIIGGLRNLPNTFVATGHNMLGLMLAPVTGRMVASGLTGKQGLAHPPFAASRF